MAKFLDTAGVNYYLQQIINQAQDTLFLISPYLKVNELLRQSLADKDRMKIDIRILYGKSDLDAEQREWFKSLKYVRICFCQNLHAKCYLNEREAIITSMNLYEFSQVNNLEMGVFVSKTEEPELYNDICNGARRLLRISEEKVATDEKGKPTIQKETPRLDTGIGHCIRCGKEVPLDSSSPYCSQCYRVWKKYKNPSHEEQYCHICGKDYKSTINNPVCYTCDRLNRNRLS